MILALDCIIGLSAPAWNNKKYLITTSLPLSLGIYLNLFVLEPLNALIICGLIFLFVSYCLDSSLELQNLLSKNIPSVALRTAIKGCMLGISITAFFIVLLNPQGEEVNLENIVSKAISFSLQQSSIETKNLAEWGIPEESKVLEKEMTDQITESVKKALDPYSHLLNVIMAFLVFLGMQGINTLIYLVFSLIIGPLYWVSKKIGCFRVESEMVQRERLSL